MVSSSVDSINTALREQLRFCSETGNIWLLEGRMLLVRADAKGELRRELIDSLGMDCAGGLFFRMGYSSGVNDFELTRVNPEISNDVEAFSAGPLIYALQGGVKTTINQLEIDTETGKFNSEITCENSWEGQSHLRDYGESDTGVCWNLLGYASGYTSALMGIPILWKEVGCIAKDLDHCTLVGKPVDEWEDANEFARLLREDSFSEILSCPYPISRLQQSALNKKKLPPELIGDSPSFRAAYELLIQASNSQITVLLQGETGVGKEIFARLLHSGGPRYDKPFIAVNCAAIPHELVESELFGVEKGAFTGANTSRPGRFQRANGGTLFLDEVGDMPLSAQVKLLRVLQEGEVEPLGGMKVDKVDVRLVTASNIDLRQQVEEGKFRSDLYYRINGLQVNIPPLRDRELDVILIAKKLLKKYSAINGKKLSGLSDKSKQLLTTYQWPGNIRELQNVIERGVLLAPEGTHIATTHLFPTHNDIASLGFSLNPEGKLNHVHKDICKDFFDMVLSGKLTMEQANTMLAQAAVARTNGNLSAAAKLLGLTRAQIAYRLEKLKPSK